MRQHISIHLKVSLDTLPFKGSSLRIGMNDLRTREILKWQLHEAFLEIQIGMSWRMRL